MRPLYSVVTDLAKFRGKSTSTPFMMARSDGQPSSVESSFIGVRLTVREQLERNDVDETLQAVGSLGYSDDLGSIGNRVVVLVTDNDCWSTWPRISGADKLTGLTLSSSDLSEGRLNLRVEGVSGHNEDDGHVLVDKRQRSVLELSSENLKSANSCKTEPGTAYTLTVHVRDLLDLQSTLETRSVCSISMSSGCDPRSTYTGSHDP
jgi:hypothetical protein